MNDDRFVRLEESVSQLREDKAALVASVEHLTDAVDKLTTTVETLSAAMNRGKGALWVIVGASTFLGGAISAGVNKLLS